MQCQVPQGLLQKSEKFSHYVFPHVLPYKEHFLRYAADIPAHIYIYYLNTIQTAITIELHVFLKMLIQSFAAKKMKTDFSAFSGGCPKACRPSKSSIHFTVIIHWHQRSCIPKNSHIVPHKVVSLMFYTCFATKSLYFLWNYLIKYTAFSIPVPTCLTFTVYHSTLYRILYMDQSVKINLKKKGNHNVCRCKQNFSV